VQQWKGTQKYKLQEVTIDNHKCLYIVGTVFSAGAETSVFGQNR